jgi:sigma-54 dependent transcriptional regulator, acetoin dehydrogenase operon transcriptional activator AcoR
MLRTPVPNVEHRLLRITAARQAMLVEGRGLSPTSALAPWVERSWQRCLQSGHSPQQSVDFDVVPRQTLQRVQEANHTLLSVARPVLARLGQAIADTRYFAILTNAQGIVVDVNGPIDRSDPRADVIARVGVDLSEQRVGTTAIGAALIDLQPVWLHRGEHFFDVNTAYSCAGAPLFGPDGACVGMLDLTGIDAVERPELKHLVAQTANKIENALVLAQPHRLLLRLNWPGNAMGGDTDGMLCLDGDGWITGANATARTMVPPLQERGPHTVHVGEVLGIAYQALFDAANHRTGPLDVPLWSGLHLQTLAIHSADEAMTVGGSRTSGARATSPLPLKDLETALIRKTVEQARGNVAQAAKTLGISRATVYRKLGRKT